jgi:hypothetical protein
VLIEGAVFGDRNEIKRETEEILKYKYITTRAAHHMCNVQTTVTPAAHHMCNVQTTVTPAAHHMCNVQTTVTPVEHGQLEPSQNHSHNT